MKKCLYTLLFLMSLPLLVFATDVAPPTFQVVGVDTALRPDIVVGVVMEATSPQHFKVEVNGHEAAFQFKAAQESLLKKTVILIDSSLSLSAYNFNRIKMSASRFIQNISDSHSVGVYSFHDNLVQHCDFSTDKARLLQCIASIQRGGNFSRLYSALSEIKEKLKSNVWNQYNSIFLLSDGFDEKSTIDEIQAVKNISSANIKVFSDGYSNVDKFYLEKLKFLSKQTNGAFSQFGNPPILPENIPGKNAILLKFIVRMDSDFFKAENQLSILNTSTNQRINITILLPDHGYQNVKSNFSFWKNILWVIFILLAVFLIAFFLLRWMRNKLEEQRDPFANQNTELQQLDRPSAVKKKATGWSSFFMQFLWRNERIILMLSGGGSLSAYRRNRSASHHSFFARLVFDRKIHTRRKKLALHVPELQSLLDTFHKEVQGAQDSVLRSGINLNELKSTDLFADLFLLRTGNSPFELDQAIKNIYNLDQDRILKLIPYMIHVAKESEGVEKDINLNLIKEMALNLNLNIDEARDVNHLDAWWNKSKSLMTVKEQKVGDILFQNSFTSGDKITFFYQEKNSLLQFDAIHLRTEADAIIISTDRKFILDSIFCFYKANIKPEENMMVFNDYYFVQLLEIYTNKQNLYEMTMKIPKTEDGVDREVIAILELLFGDK